MGIDHSRHLPAGDFAPLADASEEDRHAWELACLLETIRRLPGSRNDWAAWGTELRAVWLQGDYPETKLSWRFDYPHAGRTEVSSSALWDDLWRGRSGGRVPAGEVGWLTMVNTDEPNTPLLGPPLRRPTGDLRVGEGTPPEERRAWETACLLETLKPISERARSWPTRGRELRGLLLEGESSSVKLVVRQGETDHRLRDRDFPLYEDPLANARAQEVAQIVVDSVEAP